jgi:thiamine biosynthesis lipoprotein
MQSLAFRAMNTSIQLAAEGQGWAQIGLQATRMFIQAEERRFSRFRPASEVTRLNRSAGQWFSVSAGMLDLLRRSLTFYRETDGLFDPSILPDLKRIGYDRTLDEVRTRVDSTPVASPRTPRPALDQIELDQPRSRVRLPVGMELDFGGIAKGWIASEAAALLHTYARACAVNAGGDMLFVGQPEGQPGWTVQVEDPLDPSRKVAEFEVRSGAVATSSVAKRTWTQNGQPRHHLIDPRTGEPAQTDWLSVTVLAPDLTVAEVYAKTLLMAGPSMLDAILRNHPDIRFLAIDTHGNLTQSLEQVIEPL